MWNTSGSTSDKMLFFSLHNKADGSARRFNISLKGKKLIESLGSKWTKKVENSILQSDPWYCLLSTKNNSQPWQSKSDGAQTEAFRWKWPKMSISKLSLALKRMGSFLSFSFFETVWQPYPPRPLQSDFWGIVFIRGFQ